MLGGRKIYHQIKPMLTERSIKIGRDKMFMLIAKHQLLKKPKRRYVKTTNSKHWMRKYPNIINGKKLTGPEQLWVSNITYINTNKGNCYLNLVTDAFSLRIMGYTISESMNTEKMKAADRMTIAKRVYLNEKLVHHSDN